MGLILELPNEQTLDQQQIAEKKAQICLNGDYDVLSYGRDLQHNLQECTKNLVQDALECNTAEIDVLLGGVVSYVKMLEGAISRAKKRLSRRRTAKRLQEIYAEGEHELDHLQKDVLGQQAALMVDLKMLEKSQRQLLQHYEDLLIAVAAGKQQLAETRAGKLVELQQAAQLSQQAEAIFAFNQLDGRCANLDHRLHDLELSQEIFLQLLTQISLAHQTRAGLAAKLQSCLDNTIPLCRQMLANEIKD